MKNLQKLYLECLSDLTYLRNLFRLTTIASKWKWYIGGILFWNLYPQVIVYWIILNLYKLSVRYSLIVLDIVILDFINISLVNRFYSYIRRFLKLFFFDILFIIIPNIIRKLCTFTFWLSIFVWIVEKSIMLIVGGALDLINWVIILITIRIPLFFYRVKSWYSRFKLKIAHKKLLIRLYFDTQRTWMFYYFFYAKYFLKRKYNHEVREMLYWLSSKKIKFKMFLCPYKFRLSIIFCKLRYYIKLYLLEVKATIHTLPILKYFFILLIYKIGEYLHIIWLVIKYYIKLR